MSMTAFADDLSAARTPLEPDASTSSSSLRRGPRNATMIVRASACTSRRATGSRSCDPRRCCVERARPTGHTCMRSTPSRSCSSRSSATTCSTGTSRDCCYRDVCVVGRARVAAVDAPRRGARRAGPDCPARSHGVDSVVIRFRPRSTCARRCSGRRRVSRGDLVATRPPEQRHHPRCVRPRGEERRADRSATRENGGAVRGAARCCGEGVRTAAAGGRDRRSRCPGPAEHAGRRQRPVSDVEKRWCRRRRAKRARAGSLSRCCRLARYAVSMIHVLCSSIGAREEEDYGQNKTRGRVDSSGW